MTHTLIVPPLGESVSEATVVKWLKKQGDPVQGDEAVVELETDKITLEVNAPQTGILQSIAVLEGTKVEVGAALGEIAASTQVFPLPQNSGEGTLLAEGLAAPFDEKAHLPLARETSGLAEDPKLSPAVRKLITEHQLDPFAIQGSGKEDRLLKGDVLAYLEKEDPYKNTKDGGGLAQGKEPPAIHADLYERVPMSRLRLKIAQRLKEAQNTAAMLTTFNEIDMTNVMAARASYKDVFEKKHGVKLGFMSFFTKACVLALKEIPAVNAEIDGEDVIYKYHYDIGVAVSTPQGLVVPVVRQADVLSFAEIEKTIGELGVRAKEGKLSLAELTGGTFTITNGGIFGSLMSTPILNPPQSAILGMHKIQERPIALKGNVVIRPMMYVALTYDHRLIDGREAVTFLVRVKECIENPDRLLLEI